MEHIHQSKVRGVLCGMFTHMYREFMALVLAWRGRCQTGSRAVVLVVDSNSSSSHGLGRLRWRTGAGTGPRPACQGLVDVAWMQHWHVWSSCIPKAHLLLRRLCCHILLSCALHLGAILLLWFFSNHSCHLLSFLVESQWRVCSEVAFTHSISALTLPTVLKWIDKMSVASVSDAECYVTQKHIPGSNWLKV